MPSDQSKPIDMNTQEDLRERLRAKSETLRKAGADPRPIDAVLARVQDKPRSKRRAPKKRS